MSRALAIDLGGTNVRAGLAEPNRQEAVEPLGAWPAPEDRRAFEKMIGALVERHSVERLGIAVPGLVLGTTCRWVPNLPYLDGLDLGDLFPDVGIALGNDAQFALLAEAHEGAARGLADVILLAVGTGIGSAVLSARRIVRGAQGGAVSFGWACADRHDAGEDRHGWLERHASGSALDRIAKEVGLDGGSALVERAAQGDKRALRLLDEPAHALGLALAGAVALLDPQVVLVSGGVASSLQLLRPAILSSMHAQLPPHLRGVDIARGAFGTEASLVGAGIAAFKGNQWDRIA